MELVRFDIDSLFKACRILFGEEVLLNRQFLEYIQDSGVKTAYRQKALTTHPDRVIHLNPKIQQESKELFVIVTEAYQELMSFLKARDDKRVEIAGSDSAYVDSGINNNYNLYRFYKGQLPKRELLFAEFLYYSGNVPWKAFIDAIVWQRKLRPRFGDIAKVWNYVDDEQIRKMIKGKLLGEKIGETAIRLALLTNLQVKTIVLHQKMRQKKIGEYFAIEGFLSKDRINELYYDFRRHNALYRAKKIF